MNLCIRLWPNPARDKLIIEIVLEDQIFLNLEVTDLLGHRIAEYRQGNIYPGRRRIELGIYDIPDGIYSLNVIVESEVISKKLVVMK